MVAIWKWWFTGRTLDAADRWIASGVYISAANVQAMLKRENEQ